MTLYRSCTDRDLPVLKSIWLDCFEEQEDAAALFFQRNHTVYHAYACESDGRLVSALYLIDGTLCGCRAHYLCGASTLPGYRKRGIMSALITYALEDASRRGDRYSLLYPANDALYGFYARLGYLPACAAKEAVLDTADLPVNAGSPDLTALQASCSGNTLIVRPEFIRFAADYYGCYGAVTAQSENAFAIFQPEDDDAEVYCALYSDTDALKALLGANGIKRFRLTAPADSPLIEGKLLKPYGMIRPLRGEHVPENLFIGVTLQ